MSHSIEERCAFIRPHLRGSTGKMRISALFKELQIGKTAYREAPMCLGPEDVLDDDGNLRYVSLYKLYMDIGDPTEYEIAKLAFQTWEHWQAIANQYKVGPELEKWREEMEIKVRSEAVSELRKLAKTSTGAATFLAKKGYDDNPKSRKKEKRIHDAIKTTIDSDYERILGKRAV